MTSKFELIFSRADATLLAEMFGSNLLHLMELISSSSNHENRSDRRILLDTFPPAAILKNKKHRAGFLSLLRENEALEIMQGFGISVASNAYDELVKLNINSAQLKRLYEYLEVDFPEDDRRSEAPDTVDVFSNYGLFEHQRAAVSEVLECIRRPPYRVVLHMPTGAGKTRTAMNIISQFLRLHEPGVVLWLANTEELCEQAVAEFISSWSQIGNRKIQVQRFWDYHKELGITDGLIVAGFQKIYRKLIGDPSDFAFFAQSIKMIVVDEAHQVIAETYKAVVDAINSRNLETVLIGLTATPGRTWNEMDKDSALAGFFGKRKVTLKVKGYVNPVDYLIAEGYLARPIFEELKFNLLSESEVSQIYSDYEVSENLLKKLSADQARTLTIFNKIEDLATRHKRILIFATTVEHSETLSVLLRMKGYDAMSLSTNSLPGQRKGIIDWYKEEANDCRILCNYGILTTGFDAPKTSAAIIARPTKSLVLFSQMVGRATRGIKAGGNLESEIVTVIDVDLPGFRNMSEAFTNWEDIWE